MTAVEHDVPATPPIPDDAMVDRPSNGVCPYLAAGDGAWRSATVAREHRCGAVAPSAPLAAEKQRRLCLTADHRGCATFEAARAARPVAHDRAPTLPRPLARNTPVVLDHGRLGVAMPALRSDLMTGQAILIVLLGIAFIAIVVARLGAGGAPGTLTSSQTPQASVRSSPGTSSGPTRATAAPTEAVTPSAPDGASGAPASPVPSTAGTQTYKVRVGDTLVGIAARFGTTPKILAKFNGITNPSSLKVGQVLQIP